MDMSVSVPAVLRHLHRMADIVADDDLSSVPAIDGPTDGFNTRAVIGHVDIGMAIIGDLLTEEIPFEDHAGVGEAEQAIIVEDGAVNVIYDGARHVRAFPAEELD